jgi:signal-transduction protein with cAMP-binding, CBS, and nucleotidyltransferase domain
MRNERVGSAVVLDAHEEVLRIVTDRDLVVYGQEFVETLATTTVNEILSKVVFAVDADTNVHDLTEQMREEGVRRVPITENGTVVSIVTLDDIVCHLAAELDSPELANLAAVIEGESPARSNVSDSTA